VHRLRDSVNEAVWIVVERKATRRRATACTSRSGNAAIGDEARRIVDDISEAVH
jgi:hypothetical protein